MVKKGGYQPNQFNNIKSKNIVSYSSNSGYKSISNSNSSIDEYWYIVYIILGLILIGLIALLVYFIFFNKSEKIKSTPAPSSTPTPSSKSVELSNNNIVTIIKDQLDDMGDNYNKLPEETKERLKYCYKNPDQCPF
jgi:hypothetical protein